MKKAIIEVNGANFRTDLIMAKNNAERIAWLNGVIECYGSLGNLDLSFYKDVDDFVNKFNNCCHPGADDILITIDYTSFDGKVMKCEETQTKTVIYEFFWEGIGTSSSSYFEDWCKYTGYEGTYQELYDAVHNEDITHEEVETLYDKQDGLTPLIYRFDDCITALEESGGSRSSFLIFEVEEPVTPTKVVDTPVREEAKTETPAPVKEAKKESKPSLVDIIKLIKNDNNVDVVLRKVGDFYETYGDDARVLSKITGVTLCSRDDYPIAGFPKRAYNEFVDMLRDSGKSVHVENNFEEYASRVNEAKDSKTETPKPKVNHEYGKREFEDYAETIFQEGHYIFHTEVGMKRYVINGLFDNDDCIANIYDEETMQLVGRYFPVGAQDGSECEAEYFSNWFKEKFVGTKYWGDSWSLSQKQFDFLKNA